MTSSLAPPCIVEACGARPDDSLSNRQVWVGHREQGTLEQAAGREEVAITTASLSLKCAWPGAWRQWALINNCPVMAGTVPSHWYEVGIVSSHFTETRKPGLREVT